MTFDYFLRLFGSVTKAQRLYFKEEKTTPMELRRAAMIEGNDKVYGEIVIESTKREEESNEHIIKEAMSLIHMTAEQFHSNYNQYLNESEETKQKILSVQLNTNMDGKQKPKIHKEQAKAIYMAKANHQFMISKSMKADKVDVSKAHLDPKIKARVILEQSRLADVLFTEFGYEEEELDYAILYYKFSEDEELQQEVTKLMGELKVIVDNK
jgi:hypothetical protein